MAVVERKRPIKQIVSLVNGMVITPDMYHREQWISLMNVIDQNPGKFEIQYADINTEKPALNVYTEDELRMLDVPKLMAIAEAKGIENIPSRKPMLIKTILESQV